MNGIFPITAPDHINYQSGVMMAEAMKYAVRVINKNKNYLHGYKLGITDIFDTENDDSVRKYILDTFLAEIPFLIGPYSSETSYIGSILTGTFGQLAVSYSATYSDFEKTQNYMVRTVPTDTFRVEAAIDVVQKLQWNYIGVISSYGYNGEREARHFTSKLSEIGVCLATQSNLLKHESEQGYVKAITKMNEDVRLKALVFFTTNNDSTLLLAAIQRLKLNDRFYILCMYGCTNYIEVVKGKEQVADGILSLDIHYPEQSGFKDHFLNLQPTRKSPKYFLQFWEDVFNCTLKYKKSAPSKSKCSGNEKLSVGNGYYPLTPVNSVINAVYAIADVIKDMLENICEAEKLRKANKTRCFINVTEHKDQMTSYLVKRIPKYKDGTIKFDKVSENKTLVRYDIHHYRNHESVFVGRWIKERADDELAKNKVLPDKQTPIFALDVIWTLLPNGSLIKTHAYCSRECPFGHIKIRDINILKGKCCWTCRKCPEHSISLNDTCVQCKETEKPDHESTTCTSLPRKFIALDSAASWIFFVLSILGLVLVVFVTILFIRYNDNRIVRSSGRDLCYLILFGICLTFLCPFLFLTKPSVLSCLFRGALPGLAFISCYAPLFLRTNRIYRIFFHAKISVSRPSLISSQSQLIVSCGIVAIQMLLVVVWFVSKMPSPQETVVPNRMYVNLHCKADTSPILLLLNLALSVIFMISCTVLAFKTRHFPKNYNEAKYIGVTLYLSCVAWAVFFPGYFLTNPKTEFLREYLMCAICVAIGYITLLGLFGQKMRMLLCGVPKGVEGKTQPTWYLSDSESNEKYHPHSTNNMTIIPTHDTLL